MAPEDKRVTNPTLFGQVVEPESPVIEASDLRHIKQIIDKTVHASGLPSQATDALIPILSHIAEDAWHKPAETDGVHTLTWDEAAFEYAKFANQDRYQTRNAFKALADARHDFSLISKEGSAHASWASFGQMEDKLSLDTLSGLCQSIASDIRSLGQQRAHDAAHTSHRL